MGVAEQMMLQLADLGRNTRDTVYAPDADASGAMRHTSEARQAAVANAARAHRQEAMSSGDASTRKWNSEQLPSLQAMKSHH